MSDDENDGDVIVVQQDPLTRLPPTDNWIGQTFAYGFLLERSVDGTGFDTPDSDDIHLLNLNPQDIQFGEPFATEIAATFGGGKFIESRGWITKSCSIRGTTGLLPPVSPHSTHMQAPPESAPDDLVLKALATGFYEFYRLRSKFRTLQSERRKGKIIRMHYLDFKGDEFWYIEPKRFNLTRTRFSYTYDIQFDCIEPSQSANVAGGTNSGFGAGGSSAEKSTADRSWRRGLSTPLANALGSQRTALNRIFGLATSLASLTKSLSGWILIKSQEVLQKIGKVQSFFADIASVKNTVTNTALSLCRQAYSAVVGMEDAFTDATSYAAFKGDLNEWYLETRFLFEGLICSFQDQDNSTPGNAILEENKKYTQPRATDGTNANFMASSGTPLSADPFIGSAGFGLIGDVQRMGATTALRAVKVLTGETIFDIAQRCLGNADRFIEIVILGQLRAPFIVADPANKPPCTVAWGESIYVPANQDTVSLSVAQPVDTSVPSYDGVVSIDSTAFNEATVAPTTQMWRDGQWDGFTFTVTNGSYAGESRIVIDSTADGSLTFNRDMPGLLLHNTTFTLTSVVFSLGQVATPETRAFGRDILGVFKKVNGLIASGKVDVMWGPGGDFATVEGLANFEQAIALCLATRRGASKVNKSYGTVPTIGRKMDVNVAALYAFYVRQSLAQDPRVAAVIRPTVTGVGTVMTFSAAIKPINVQKTLQYKTPI